MKKLKEWLLSLLNLPSDDDFFTQCKECEKEVAKTVKICPHCLSYRE